MTSLGAQEEDEEEVASPLVCAPGARPLRPPACAGTGTGTDAGLGALGLALSVGTARGRRDRPC